MKRKTRSILAGAAAAGFVAIAVTCLPMLLRGDDTFQPPAGKLVVHEWGTFTSFAGSDGVSLEFRPLATNDLPPFVIRETTPTDAFVKAQTTAFQRMETPVIYFYTDTPQIVNVGVDFPKGMLTEYYPAAKQFQSGKKTDTRAMGGAFLDWGAVRLTPAGQFAKVNVVGPVGMPMPASLPAVAENNHYGRARETDSAIVETVNANKYSQFEKFLFYRGLGNFEMPIKLVAIGNDKFEIANASERASGAVLLVHIENDRARFSRINAIKPRSIVEAQLPLAKSTVDQLAEATVRELVAAGLYEKEALAMVNTWRTSWFGENGTRLFYLVPRQLTDELLPLGIDPAPDECVRVLVGRLETLTPEDCQRLVVKLVGDGVSSPPALEALHAELANLGRFAEPTLQFVISQSKEPRSRARLEQILAEFRAVPKWGL